MEQNGGRRAIGCAEPHSPTRSARRSQNRVVCAWSVGHERAANTQMYENCGQRMVPVGQAWRGPSFCVAVVASAPVSLSALLFSRVVHAKPGSVTYGLVRTGRLMWGIPDAGVPETHHCEALMTTAESGRSGWQTRLKNLQADGVRRRLPACPTETKAQSSICAEYL